MGTKKHIIDLSDTERKKLKEIVKKGEAPARTILRANILLASDKNSKNPMTIAKMAEVYHTTSTTIENVRVSYEKKGLKGTIYRKKRETPPVPAKVTGEMEARIIALACSEPPKGYERWSLRLIAEKCVELNYADCISHMTIARILKKTSSNPI